MTWLEITQVFVKNALEESKKQADDFLLFFENLQPGLLQTHRKLLEFYTE
ncbi:MAG: hypothetical protein GX889_08260 [Clostridiales bacterium]|nr:hypothetical protein [Clostridium sp. N3C]NLZ34878.1 hypothetical protein [Clostridiales bacterium]